MTNFQKIKSADDLFEIANLMGVYYSLPSQMTFAFNNGDIATITFVTAPIRKNKAPYSGCFVKDGTISDNDWEEGKFV